MDLESFVEDYLQRASLEILTHPEGKTGEINENLLICETREDFLKLYSHLLAKGFYNEEKLNEFKEFFYCFVIRKLLKNPDFDDFELILDDLNEIRKSSLDISKVEKWIFEKMTLTLCKARTIQQFKEFLKKLLVLGSRTRYRTSCFYETAGSFGSALVLQLISKTKSAEEIIQILDELEELVEVKIFQESFFIPIITGITSKITLLHISFSQDLSENIKKIKEKLKILLPNNSSNYLNIFENITRPILYKFNKKQKIFNFSFEKLEAGRLVSFTSSSRARLTWQIFHPFSEFQFQSFLVKQYEFTDPEFEAKIEAEIIEAEAFKGFRGFSQMLFKEKAKIGNSFRYRICFSSGRKVEKESLTEKQLHEILDVFFFLFKKKMRARLLDPDLIFVNENDEFVVSDFSLVNFKYTAGYSSKFYDVLGDFFNLPRVGKKFLRSIFKVVGGLIGHLPEDIQENIKARLNLNAENKKDPQIVKD